MATSVPESLVCKSVGGVDISLSIYWPLLPPTVACGVQVFIHGGGGLTSDRSGIAHHVERAPNTHNLVVISPDYRLGPQASIQDTVDDIRDCVAFVRGALGAGEEEVRGGSEQVCIRRCSC